MKNIKIIVTEGEGSYKGRPRNYNYHPKGRMGAKLEAYINDILVYETKNASTLPDSITKWYADYMNGGSPIPCVCVGKYEIYTKMHLGKHKALELGKPNESINVIRDDKLSTSSGINLHYRAENDPLYNAEYASSIGCITVLSSDLMSMFKALEITSFKGEYVGELIVRRNLSKELYNHYKKLYPSTIDYFSAVEEAPVEECLMQATKDNINAICERIEADLSELKKLVDTL